MINILDIGGNYGSLLTAFDKIGAPAQVRSWQEFDFNAAVIIPGMGRADTLKQRLGIGFNALSWHNGPVLGICVGYHILCQHSEEGNIDGLRRFESDVKKLPFAHFGWKQTDWGWMYFCHEYSTGKDAEFNANWIGVQFHPEKSGKDDLEFLRTWATNAMRNDQAA